MASISPTYQCDSPSPRQPSGIPSGIESGSGVVGRFELGSAAMVWIDRIGFAAESANVALPDPAAVSVRTTDVAVAA